METVRESLLIVEDNQAVSDLLTKWLRGKGYTAVVCGDGYRALELVQTGDFDLVLLDVGVPGCDGFEILRALRTRYPPSVLPVIMATALGESEMVVMALQLGANDYVTKPYDLPVLLARVQTQLSAKRTTEQRDQLERMLATRNEELEQANHQLRESNRRMKADLQAAARIQEALLPATTLTIPGVQLAWAFRPCADLAGDTLNVFPLDPNHLGLYLLDVTGHGVPAALLSVHLSLMLSPTRDSSSLLVRADGPIQGCPVPPAEVVSSLNRRFVDHHTERFLTLFYGVLNRESGELSYTSAGHPGPAHLSSDSSWQMLPPSGLPIGLEDRAYQEHLLRLKSGDRLYLFSDGVTEATSPDGQMYGPKRLVEVLLKYQSAPLKASLAALLGDVETWSGRQLSDDLSVLALEYTGLLGT